MNVLAVVAFVVVFVVVVVVSVVGRPTRRALLLAGAPLRLVFLLFVIFATCLTALVPARG